MEGLFVIYWDIIWRLAAELRPTFNVAEDDINAIGGAPIGADKVF